MHDAQGRQIFTFTLPAELEIKAKVENGEKTFYLKGTILTDKLDEVRDIATKRCREGVYTQFGKRVIKLDYEHEAVEGDTRWERAKNRTLMPLGAGIDRKLFSDRVDIEWKLNSSWKKFDKDGIVTMTFDELIAAVNGGFYDAFSIAYYPTETREVLYQDGKIARLLDWIDIINVALTGNPVQLGAKITKIFAKSLRYLENIKSEKPEGIHSRTHDTKGDNVVDDETKTQTPPEDPGVKTDPIPAGDAKPEDTKPLEPEAKSLVDMKTLLSEFKSKLKEFDKKAGDLETKHADLDKKHAEVAKLAKSHEEILSQVRQKALRQSMGDAANQATKSDKPKDETMAKLLFG